MFLEDSAALVGWYLLVALQHALWDASRPIAVWLTLLLTATQMQWLPSCAAAGGRRSPSSTPSRPPGHPSAPEGGQP